MVKRYRISFEAESDGKPETAWFSSEMIALNDALSAIQTVIDQLGRNPEWRNGAVLAYNAISASRQVEHKLCPVHWGTQECKLPAGHQGDHAFVVILEMTAVNPEGGK